MLTKTAVAIAALLGLAAASPRKNISSKSSFKIKQVPVGTKKYTHPAVAIAKAYAKFGAIDAVPAPVVEAAAAAPSGVDTAVPDQDDTEYLSPVTIGSTTLNLDFDTGSSDLWVFSSLQPKSQTSGHTIYNVASGTVKSGYSWKISYGDGSGAAGKVYVDKVVVGGVTATSQAVEAATSVSAAFASSADVNTDGLLGLASSSINTVTPQAQTTFFDTVKSTLASQLFAVRLRKGAAGAYDFGFIDTTQYTGAITYVTRAAGTTAAYWGFNAGAYQIGTGASTGSIGAAIADTGTTLLLLPDAVVDAYYAKVPGARYDNTQGGYTFPSTATLPDFTISIGAGTFTVPGSYISFAAINNAGTTIYGGIQSNSGLPFSIFGDIFLKAQYVIFDEGNNRLGFAKGA